MGETMFDAMGVWFRKSSFPLTAGALVLTFGTYLVSSQSTNSTFFCSSRDSPSLVYLFQLIGLLFDGIIITLLWRTLAWARTTKSRLRTLSGILLASALGLGFLYWSTRLFQQPRPMSYHFRGLDSLYIFDTAVDGVVFSICMCIFLRS